MLMSRSRGKVINQWFEELKHIVDELPVLEMSVKSR